MPSKPTTLLIVLDGWGHREDADDNAISKAQTPVWDKFINERPHCLISGSGVDVGLPEGQMGNSEVGHMNLGAGRVIYQDFTRISKAVSDGSFAENPVLTEAMEPIASNDKALHILGLVSPGGVHSHEDHIVALIKAARVKNISRIYLHAFLDGRDVPPRSAHDSLAKLEKIISESGEGGIASVIGRYYAMDRDKRWERVAPAYHLIVNGEAEYQAETPTAALANAYERDESDEFVKATSIAINGSTIKVDDGDGIIFMNFRADRARQISRAFVEQDFSDFERTRVPGLSTFVSLTEYAADIPTTKLYPPQSISNSLGEYVASLGKKQLRLAETEKYAHVTFFFSGGRETPFTHEQRILVPSPDVATYDLKPEMSAHEVTDELVKAIGSGGYDLVICNYANGDMVGHTGDFQAAIEAVECLDECLGRIEAALMATGSQCLITADHGNVEQMRDMQTEQPHTAHTSELVPLVYVGPETLTLNPTDGVLSDVAPTLLSLMQLPQPDEMTGQSLVLDAN